MSDFKKELLGVLNEIKGSGSFVNTNSRTFIFPGLEIQGVGEIGFPINTLEIREMIKFARKAPFGRGTETVLDATVRSAWEIDAGQMTFSNSDWNNFVASIIEEIKPALGINGQGVSTNLYKLLIYEEGDFFLAHKDSEKEKGMFGTLIIGLPSKHTGGELTIEFDGRQEKISFSEPISQYKIPFVAFYADCTHELSPITSGYRVCLVYNLVQDKGREEIQLHQLGGYVDRLADIMKNHEEDEDIPKIVLLGHQYTPSNFAMEALKLNDRPKAEVILLAAQKAGFYAKLGLVTSYQSGELKIEYGNSSSRSKYRSSYYDDFGDYDNQDLVDNGTLGEIYDERIDVEHWMDEGVPPLRNISFGEEDLVSAIKLNEGDPIEKEVEGYTGNAGMEMQYWYHYGAVFLWPRKHHYHIFTNLTIYNKLEWVAYYNKQWDFVSADEVSLIKKLLEDGLDESWRRNNADYTPLADLLINLKDEKYLAGKGLFFLTNYFRLIAVKSWIVLFETYASSYFEKIFTAAGLIGKMDVAKHLLAILKELDKADFNYRTFVIDQTNQIPNYLAALDLSSKTENAMVKEILRSVLELSKFKVGDHLWLSHTAEVLTKVLTREYVNDVLLKIVVETDRELALAIKIVAVCKKDLMRRVDRKPLPPADWSRPLPEFSKSHKKVWALLADFLESPTQQIFDYRKAQVERTEMENAIINVTIDIKTETIRKGMPHTLRLIKTQDAYERELAKWETDVLLLEKVNGF